MARTAVAPMRGHHVLEYPFKRSLGPVLTRFFTDLRDRRFVGIRSASGRVLVPPAEYDPETGEALSEFVPVGPAGDVVSWSWVKTPRPQQPLDRPFAYALIRLDGADTPLVHVVDVPDEALLAVGMRVAPRWAAEPVGSIRDVECFVPEASATEPSPPSEAEGDVEKIVTPIHLEYDLTAGEAASVFLRGVQEGKLIGARVREGSPVYVPARGADPRTAELTQDYVEVKDTGTVVTYSIVRVPSENIHFELPYVTISVLLDGADLPCFHVLQNCPLEEVRAGMRVKAVWAPKEELVPSIDSIRYFEPLDEPDVPFEQFKEHT